MIFCGCNEGIFSVSFSRLFSCENLDKCSISVVVFLGSVSSVLWILFWLDSIRCGVVLEFMCSKW